MRFHRSGQVTAGALDLLRQTLPIEEVTVEQLPRLVKDRSKVCYILVTSVLTELVERLQIRR